MRHLDWLEDFGSDLAYALRQLVRKPVFTLVVMLTLAVGIGANTAIFSVVNGMLLRPLPVPDAGRLVVLAARQDDKRLAMGISYPQWLATREATTAGDGAVFTDLAGFAVDLVGIATEEQAEQAAVAYVTGNFFSLLKLEARHGRLLLPSEGTVAGADPVIVLGHGFWQRHLDSDPSIVGRTVKLNGSPYTVVGVTPEGFLGPVAMVELAAFMPLSMHRRFDAVEDNREVYPAAPGSPRLQSGRPALLRDPGDPDPARPQFQRP